MLVTQDGLVLDITFELTASLLVAIVEVQEPIIIHAWWLFHGNMGSGCMNLYQLL